MNNFYKRSITGILFVLVLGGAILFNAITFFALLLVIVALGLAEFYRLMDTTPVKANKIIGLLGGLLLLSLTCLYAVGCLNAAWFWIVVPVISSVFVAELYRKHDQPFQNIAITLLGVFYITVPFSLLVLIGFPQQSMAGYQPSLVIGLFFLLWASDTGAYLTGITIGKHPMFPRISPKKSWEGFAGGMFFTLLVAFIISKYFVALPLVDWLIIAVIVCVFGVFGDLIESMLKRSLNIKDSGNILPGHGGILDRFDSILFSAPIVFVYLQLKNLMLF